MNAHFLSQEGNFFDIYGYAKRNCTLARRVAAQLGVVEPSTLQRVIRVVGTGSRDQAAAGGLHTVFEEWQHADTQVSPFIPDANKTPLVIASAARYLATTPEMDQTLGSTPDRFGPARCQEGYQ